MYHANLYFAAGKHWQMLATSFDVQFGIDLVMSKRACTHVWALVEAKGLIVLHALLATAGQIVLGVSCATNNCLCLDDVAESLQQTIQLCTKPEHISLSRVVMIFPGCVHTLAELVIAG